MPRTEPPFVVPGPSSPPLLFHPDGGNGARPSASMTAPASRVVMTWLLRMPVILAAVWVGLVVLGAVLAPYLHLPDPAAAVPVDRLQGPSSGHWLGTDNLGRDTASRIVHGARVSLIVGFGSVLLGASVGVMIGLVCGFFRGWVDIILSWLVDVVMSFPGLVLLIAVVSFAGGGLRNVTLTMALLTAPVFARLARVHTMTVSGEEFVMAARAGGSGRFRVLRREILPSVLLALSGYVLISLGVAIVTEGGLSFLGLSVSEPTPSWGGLIAGGQSFVSDSTLGILAPSAALCLTVLSLNVLGERIRRRVETGE